MIWVSGHDFFLCGFSPVFARVFYIIELCYLFLKALDFTQNYEMQCEDFRFNMSVQEEKRNETSVLASFFFCLRRLILMGMLLVFTLWGEFVV